MWLQIATDFPDARWIQASVGVRRDTSSRVGGALSLTPGDDQDGRWGDTLSPGSLGFGLGFASCWDTSLTPILLRDFVVYVFYVETVPDPQTAFANKLFAKPVSTMVSGRDAPYHRPYPGDARTKCIDLIPTPWAMTRALGLTRVPLQHK